MKQTFKKFVIITSLCGPITFVEAGIKETIQETGHAIQNNTHHVTDILAVLAVVSGSIISCNEYHAKGLSNMSAPKALVSAALLLSGAVVFSQTQNIPAALALLGLSVSGVYYGTKPVAPVVDFEI